MPAKKTAKKTAKKKTATKSPKKAAKKAAKRTTSGRKTAKKSTAGRKTATKKTAAKKKAKAPARRRKMTPSEQKAYIQEIKKIVKDRTGTLKDFRVGETVVEPSIGICRIHGIKRQTVDGRQEDYYIFDSGTAKVYVPLSQIETRGVRRPMTRDEVKRIYSQMKMPVVPTRGDARLQYLAYREVMKSGDPGKISRLLRELFMLDKMDELKGKEKEIMEQAKKFLVDEIAFIRGEVPSTILEEVQECLETMYKKKVDKDKIARAKRRAAQMGEEYTEETGEESSSDDGEE